MTRTMLSLGFAALAAPALFMACSSDESSTPPNLDAGPSDTGSATDAAPDRGIGPPPAACDKSKPFSAPVLLPGPINVVDRDGGILPHHLHASLSHDELVIYMIPLIARISVAVRPDRNSPFGPFSRVPRVSDDYRYGPWLTDDGQTLFFYSGEDDDNIYRARRNSATGEFLEPERVDGLDLPRSRDSSFDSLSQRGADLWFSYGHAKVGYFTRYELYRSQMNGDSFGAAAVVTELTDPNSDNLSPVPSRDGRVIFFARGEIGRLRADIWVARRNTTSEPFSTPERVPELNTEFHDAPLWLSPDDCRLYLSSGRPPGSESGADLIYVAERPPLK